MSHNINDNIKINKKQDNISDILTNIKKPDISIIENDKKKIIECLKQLEGIKRTLQNIIREQTNEINIKT